MTDYLANHAHISEREADGTWEDCTWDAGLEWYRLTRDARKPATHTEAQALRKASGEPATGGSNISDFRKGVSVRYGSVLPTAISGFNALWNALAVGYAALAQGSMAAFGPTHRLSQYDRNFDGGHAVMVARIDSTDRVWWCDPEAPTGTYSGTWASKAELKAFVDKFAGQHLVGQIRYPATPPTETPMPALTSYTPGTTATIKPTGNIRTAPDLAPASKVRVSTGEKVVIIGTVAGALDTGSTKWYVWWEGNRYLYTHSSNVTATLPCGSAVPAPDTTPYSQAQLDGAVAAQRAKDDAAMAAHLSSDTAAMAKARSDAQAAERLRVRTILGL